MSQQQILDILEKEPDRWFTAKDILAILKINSSSIGHSVKKLSTAKSILSKRNPSARIPHRYKHKPNS